jgi:hypothetical protein
MDKILRDGDFAVFDLQFPPAVVFWIPIPIQATNGKAMLKDKKICVKGDETSVKMDACPYTVPGYAAPGVGELVIILGPDQVAKKTKSGGKNVLLKGSGFTAKLTVKTPAKVAVAPAVVEDPVTTYVGRGRFVTLNFTHKAT